MAHDGVGGRSSRGASEGEREYTLSRRAVVTFFFFFSQKNLVYNNEALVLCGPQDKVARAGSESNTATESLSPCLFS